MEQEILLDTHVLVWLYGGDIVNKLSPRAMRAIESASGLATSPMSILELDYLYESGKVLLPSSSIIEYLAEKIGLTICSDETVLKLVEIEERPPVG